MKICVYCNWKYDGSGWRCPSCEREPQILDGYPAFAPEFAERSEGFKTEIFPQLAELEARNFWFRARNRLITWALRKYFPFGRNFFEIGCGTGFVLSGVKDAFPHLALHGSEIYCAGLHFVSKRLPNATLFQMDARQIPFLDEFDVIGAFDVLEHIQEDRLVLSEMYKAISPGGGIILTVPQHEFLWSQSDVYACHVRRYEARDLIDKVVRAGFCVEKSSSFVSLLLPIMVASRWRNRVGRVRNDPLAELRVGGLVNTVVKNVLKVATLVRTSVRTDPLEELRVGGWLTRCWKRCLTLSMRLFVRALCFPLEGPC